MKDSRKLIERITKWNEYKNPYLEKFNTTWLENGFECACDSYRVVRLNNPIGENLEVRENEITKFFEPINEYEYVKVELPSVSVLKAHISDLIGKAYKTKRVCYRIGNDSKLGVVNAKYLLDLMEILQTNEIYYNADKPKITPLYMKSEIGDALILPIMCRTEENREYWEIVGA